MPLQLPSYARDLFKPARYKCLYGGRGGAKSFVVADYLIMEACREPMRILCAREFQTSIADSVHALLAARIAELGLSNMFDIQEKTITALNGSEFIFKGLRRNTTEIKGLFNIKKAWVEEAQVVSSASWELLIPTVREQDSEIIVTFNPKHATDATYKRFVIDPPPNSFVRKVSYRDNPFFPTVLEQERLELLRKDPEAYDHVWEGNFDTRFSGGIYAKWFAALHEKGQITKRVQHDPMYPVYTLWDLGWSDTTAIWFYQVAPKEVLFIDYYENNGEEISHYCNVIKGEHPDSLHRSGYKYNGHYVPADAAHKLLAAGGKSIADQARREGVIMNIIPETTHANRHSALRKVLPHCWFNSVTCADGVEAGMAYHFKYDEDLQIFRKEPVHDWSSHASTALELLPSVLGGAITTDELKSQEIEHTFHRLRSANNLNKTDPYRIKKR